MLTKMFISANISRKSPTFSKRFCGVLSLLYSDVLAVLTSLSRPGLPVRSTSTDRTISVVLSQKTCPIYPVLTVSHGCPATVVPSWLHCPICRVLVPPVLRFLSWCIITALSGCPVQVFLLQFPAPLLSSALQSPLSCPSCCVPTVLCSLSFTG